MPSRFMNRLGRDQRGITGLETAIILIAFVVVASVFAYTVLSAGIFSAEKGKEAVHAGLSTARSSMELVGSVKATSVAAVTLDTADSTWSVSANVTEATDTSDRKEGTASRVITIDAAFTTGLAAYSDISSADISAHYSARLWVKSDISTAAGDLSLVIDEGTGCSAPEETLSLPALTAGTWKQVLLKMTDGSALSAVLCVGLTVGTDNGAQVVTLDIVEAPAEVTQVSFVVANALDGEAINLTTTTDLDGDGLISDETAGNTKHVLSAIYSDLDQRVTDVTWTQAELGKGDGDQLLEPGEKMLITVQTHAADPMPVDDSTFSIILARESGSDMVIERTLPSVLNTQMDLN